MIPVFIKKWFSKKPLKTPLQKAIELSGLIHDGVLKDDNWAREFAQVLVELEQLEQLNQLYMQIGPPQLYKIGKILLQAGEDAAWHTIVVLVPEVRTLSLEDLQPHKQ